MLTGLEFWHLVSHIIPVYAIVLLGYGSVRFGLLKQLHLPGVSRFVAMIGVPFYAFYLLAFNNPYNTSFGLVGADALQKAVALALGSLWWRFSPTGSIDNLIDFFMLATLPNTVLIGSSLLQPLYGDEVLGKIVTIIFLQCFIWYNLTIALYELRGVLLSEKAEQNRKDIEEDLEMSRQKLGKHSSRSSNISIIVDRASSDHHDIDSIDSNHKSQRFSSNPDIITRTSSAPPRISTLSKVFPVLPPQPDAAHTEGNEGFSARNSFRFAGSFSPNVPNAAEINPSAGSFYYNEDRAAAMSSATEPAPYFSSRDEDPPPLNRAVTRTDAVLEQAPPFGKPKMRSSNSFVFAGKVFLKAVNRLKYAPLTYGSLVGFFYSLFAFKFDWTMPYSVLTSVELISNGAVGLALFVLGTTWANSGKLILCGWRTMVWGMFIRFVISPFILIVTALIVGLKGNSYRFAVLQAVIPQGIISFVLAKEYGLHEEVFATAVIAQLLVFVPIVIIYYIALDSV